MDRETGPTIHHRKQREMRVGARCGCPGGGGPTALGASADCELVQDVLGEEDGCRSALFVFLGPKDFLTGCVDALSEGGVIPGEHEFEEVGRA